MKFFVPLLIICFAFGSYNKKQSTAKSISASTKTTHTQIIEGTQLPYLDTSITISNYKISLTNSKPLNDREAKKLFYNHFRSKGILSRSEQQLSSAINKDRVIVDYDTIYRIQLANTAGAVVSYWLGPADLNGHCFQPSKAVILNTNKGYRVTNEAFIPSSFIIDSTKGANIYGYEYECGGRGILRQFRITLR